MLSVSGPINAVGGNLGDVPCNSCLDHIAAHDIMKQMHYSLLSCPLLHTPSGGAQQELRKMSNLQNS